MSAIRWIVVAAVICALSPRLTAQRVNVPVNFENAAVVIEKAVQDAGKSYITTHGTGFFYSDSVSGRTFVVTNRHLLKGHDSLFVRFNSEDGITARVPICLRTPDHKLLWFGDPDSLVDLAVMPFVSALRVWCIDDWRAKPVAEVRLGDEVVFIGFPLLGYAGTDRVLPVFRHGIVSFVSKEDLLEASTGNPVLKKDHILVDARSMGGNSGGPVISAPRSGSGKASLIGVIQGHMVLTEGRDDSGLGIVIPVDRLIETVKQYNLKFPVK